VHFLTKFLVVVASVLSVLLAGLSVGLAYNAEAAVRDYSELESALSAAKSQVSDRESRALVERDALQEQLEMASRDRANARNRLAQTRGELERINQQLIETRRQAQTFEAELSGFRALLQTMQDVDQARADELENLRESEIDYAMREIALTDQINELSSQLEVAQETNRSLLEEVTQLRERVDLLASGAGATGDTATGTRPAPRGFRGRVTSVEANPAGGQLVGINAGSQDNLAERMKLRVTRNGQFVATLIIREVNLNDSIAVVDVSAQGMQVEEGDAITPAN